MDVALSAVDSVLGTLSSALIDEAQLLSGVHGDVQFIKDEIESMNGFLLDAAGGGRPSNNQVRAWTRQVREVAYDSQNYIDRYVQTFGASRPSAGLLGTLRSAPWLLWTWHDRHRIATQIRELKARARDVGERRHRYGVKVIVPETGEPQATARVSTGRDGAASIEEEEDARRRRSALDVAIELLDTDASALEVIAWLKGEPHRPKHGADSLGDAWKNVKGANSKYDALTVELIKYERRLLGDKDSQNIGEAVDVLMKEMPVTSVVTGMITDSARNFLEEAETKARARVKQVGAKVREKARKMGLGGGWLMDIVLGGDQPGKPTSDGPSQGEEKGKAAAGVRPQEDQEKKEKEEPSLLALQEQYMEELIRWLREVFGHEQPQAKFLAIVTPPVDMSNPEADEAHTYKRATELAKRVYDHHSAKSHFDCMVWVDARLHSQRKQRLQCILKQLLRSGEDDPQIDEDEKLEQEIRDRLGGKKRFLIVFADHEDLSPWEHITKALPPDHSDDSAIIVTPLIQQASHFNGWYMASWFFLLRASHYKVHFYSHLNAVSKQANELLVRSHGSEDLQDIVDNILKKCRWDSFSTKMILQALYANRHRSRVELKKLLHSLTDFNTVSNAEQTTRFCYDDLPSHYKSCLLYLSVFPPDFKIRRTSLVRRWAAENLISKRDGLSATHEAGRCFDALIARGLVLPDEIGLAGKVKSCRVHSHVLSFITKIASDENVGSTGLPPDLAHRLSICSGIQLPQLSKKKQQATDSNACWRPHKPPPDFKHHLYGMVAFLNLLPTSFQLGLVKVLDLEGCNGLKKQNLKKICNKLFQIKYLSLRNTDVTELPKEIYKLRYLETFDIRQTTIHLFPAKSIIMLQKLVHLLAGNIGSDKSFSTIHMPHGIGSMTNMEILSHVEVSETGDENELAEVGRLQKLRKLGVVIHGNEARLLTLLLRVIGKLNECLCSLSVRIEPVKTDGGFRSKEAHSEADDMKADEPFSPPKSLASLSIYGRISGLPTWIRELINLSKITLLGTYLTDSDVQILGELVNLRCIVLLHESYTNKKLTLRKKEFKQLKFLLIEGTVISDIHFEHNSAPKIEKIVWTSTSMENLYGIDKLPSLKKIELNGNCDMRRIKEDMEANPNYPILTHNPIPDATTAVATADVSNISGVQ